MKEAEAENEAVQALRPLALAAHLQAAMFHDDWLARQKRR